jgi:RecJ-like exonuclease
MAECPLCIGSGKAGYQLPIPPDVCAIGPPELGPPSTSFPDPILAWDVPCDACDGTGRVSQSKRFSMLRGRGAR